MGLSWIACFPLTLDEEKKVDCQKDGVDVTRKQRDLFFFKVHTLIFRCPSLFPFQSRYPTVIKRKHQYRKTGNFHTTIDPFLKVDSYRGPAGHGLSTAATKGLCFLLDSTSKLPIFSGAEKEQQKPFGEEQFGFESSGCLLIQQQLSRNSRPEREEG